jgi:hypothetical protein
MSLAACLSVGLCVAGLACSPVTPSSDTETGDDGEESVPLGDRLFDAGFDPERVGWRWVRELAEGWRITESRFEIRSDDGTLWEQNNSARNVALREPPALPFSVTATVTGRVLAGGEQGGFLWYAGDDQYVKLVREMVGGVRSVVIVRETPEAVLIEGLAQTGLDDVELRLDVGDEIVGWWRAVGATEWAEVGRAANAWPVGELGVFSHGGGAKRWTRFGPLVFSP